MELYPLDSTTDVLVRNILSVYYRATTGQYARGMTWYETAHDLALMVGKGDPIMGAGVIAALSANVGWGQNRKMAVDLSREGSTRGLPNSIGKATAILAGGDPTVILGNGLKTQAFFDNIAHPTTSQQVTVDRHAHDVAVGKVYGKENRGLSTPKRYELFADAFRDAAQDIGGGILPSQVQAVTWIAWTEEIAGTSTRGPRKD
jgi:hypothetical protein